MLLSFWGNCASKEKNESEKKRRKKGGRGGSYYCGFDDILVQLELQNGRCQGRETTAFGGSSFQSPTVQEEIMHIAVSVANDYACCHFCNQ